MRCHLFTNVNNFIPLVYQWSMANLGIQVAHHWHQWRTLLLSQQPEGGDKINHHSHSWLHCIECMRALYRFGATIWCQYSPYCDHLWCWQVLKFHLVSKKNRCCHFEQQHCEMVKFYDNFLQMKKYSIMEYATFLKGLTDLCALRPFKRHLHQGFVFEIYWKETILAFVS